MLFTSILNVPLPIYRYLHGEEYDVMLFLNHTYKKELGREVQNVLL